MDSSFTDDPYLIVARRPLGPTLAALVLLTPLAMTVWWLVPGGWGLAAATTLVLPVVLGVSLSLAPRRLELTRDAVKVGRLKRSLVPYSALDRIEVYEQALVLETGNRRLVFGPIDPQTVHRLFVAVSVRRAWATGAPVPSPSDLLRQLGAVSGSISPT